MVAKEDNYQDESIRENLEQIEDSDAEESLSFCDLPIYDPDPATATATATASTSTKCDGNDDDDRRRLSTDQELFEFFSDLKADMCPADDIIFCGKLVEKEYHHEEDKNPIHDDDDDGNQTCTIKSFFQSRRRRSESLNGLQRSESNAKSRMMRTNHSLDYRKLRRVSSSTKTPVELNDRYMSGKCSGKANSSTFSAPSCPARPKRPLMMFGMVNVPKEMELKDIRNRQTRRNPTFLFPTSVAGGDTEKVKVRRQEKKGSWRLLRVLSCRGDIQVVR